MGLIITQTTWRFELPTATKIDASKTVRFSIKPALPPGLSGRLQQRQPNEIPKKDAHHESKDATVLRRTSSRDGLRCRYRDLYRQIPIIDTCSVSADGQKSFSGSRACVSLFILDLNDCHPWNFRL